MSIFDFNERGFADDETYRQAKALQSSLLALVDRVETVKSEHDKLEGENKFLQSSVFYLLVY